MLMQLKLTTLLQNSFIVLIIFNHSFGFCAILVINKLTKSTVLTVKHQLFATTGSDKGVEKAQLIIYQSSKRCSIPKPQVDLQVHSLHSNKIVRPFILLVLLSEADQCDIKNKIAKSQVNGYSGIIFYQNELNSKKLPDIQDMDLRHIFISLISNNDGILLAKYAKPQYTIQVHRDLPITERLFTTVKNVFEKSYSKLLIFLNFAKPLLRYFEIWLQMAILIGPCIYILRRSMFTSQSRDEWWYKIEEEQWRYEMTPSSELHLSEYRELLGVTENASREEIERAFRRRASPFHPDRHTHLPDEERLQKQEEFKTYSIAKIALLESLGKQERF